MNLRPFYESLLVIYCYIAAMVSSALLVMFAMEVHTGKLFIARPMGEMATLLVAMSLGYLSSLLLFSLVAIFFKKSPMSALNTRLGYSPENFPLFSVALLATVTSMLETIVIASPPFGLVLTLVLIIFLRRFYPKG